MADEKAKIVTDATGPGSGPAPAQPEAAAQVPKQEQSAYEAELYEIETVWYKKNAGQSGRLSDTECRMCCPG